MAAKSSKRLNSYKKRIPRKLRIYITSAVLGGIAAGVALVLFSLIVFLFRLPIVNNSFFSLLAFGTGCLVAGFSAGSLKRQGGLGAGVKAALLFAAPIILISIVLSGLIASEIPTAAAEPSESLATTARTLNRIIVAIMCGAVGGVLGVNRNGGF